jgi:hypothetical protein
MTHATAEPVLDTVGQDMEEPAKLAATNASVWGAAGSPAVDSLLVTVTTAQACEGGGGTIHLVKR